MPSSTVTSVLQAPCNDLVGALNDVANYAAGVSTIDVDGLTAAAIYPAGIKFRITGDLTVYTTTIQKTTAAGAFTGLTFTPPLAAAALDNAVVTFEVHGDVYGADGDASTYIISVSGIAGGAVLTPEGSLLGSNPPVWFGVGQTPMTSTTMAATISADGIYRIVADGLYRVRVRVSTAGTGTITVVWQQVRTR
jgi:hypothetical protein